MKNITRDGMKALVGKPAGASDWFLIDQSRIDVFADVTEDHQFIHVDAEAAKETPFGTTIAHGFLTLSMLSAMIYNAVPDVEGATMGINYGFNKIRFLSPVAVNARIRAHFTLQTYREDKPNEGTSIWDISVEIEGQSRPALVAEWIGRRYYN